ncbi:MAG: ATP-binding protein, partial [Syntrophales bacterium]|nr:ATP-binding protein [Syntrophales bacterium]
YRLNMQTCRYEYISASAERIVGFSPAELMARDAETALAMIHPDDLSAVRAALARLKETGVERLEYRQRAKSGEYRWLSNHMSLTKDSRGRPIYRDGNIRDITERKGAEEVLNRQSAKLEVANKELESFAYSISHDLRAPLRAIDGFSRMLLLRMADKMNDDEKRQFEVIRDNTARMNQLIEDVLNFSRLGRHSLSLTDIDITDLANGIWEELISINPCRRMSLKMDALSTVVGDAALIRQVLANLLSNAVKFTRKSENALIEIGGRTGDSETVYYVRDNGTGFDMKYYEKLFGVFQRLHSEDEYEGTGAGLAIVKRIITRHGGRVWAEGEVGRGACFYFSLPARSPDEKSPPTPL